MAQQESITMSQKQLSRYEVIKNLISGFINGTEAAKQISLSARQVRRLKAKFDSSEGVIPVFAFWKEYAENQGKPLKIYLDRYSTYKINTKHL